MLESPRHGQVREQEHPHQRHDTWRAGCGESRTSGSEGGPGKPTSREAGRAPRSDPYSPIATTTKRKFFYLYAVIDIYSRFVPGWCVEEVEDKDLARELFEMTCEDQQITPGTLTVHSDNGPQMRSDAMNEFYAIAGISQSRSRPRVCLFTGYSVCANAETSSRNALQLAA